jgi:tetratricopeptide (TPR) repeat protein
LTAAPAAAIAAVVCAAVLLWRPAWLKWRSMQAAAVSMMRSSYGAAIGEAERAARADPLDDIVAADAARLILAVPRTSSLPAMGNGERALYWAKEAVRRNPASSANERLAANIQWRLDGARRAGALARIRRSAEMDPANARLQIEAAGMLCAAGEFDESLRFLSAAEEIDRRLEEFSLRYQTPDERAAGAPPSRMMLSAEDRAELESIKAAARAERKRPVDRLPDLPIDRFRQEFSR